MDASELVGKTIKRVTYFHDVDCLVLRFEGGGKALISVVPREAGLFFMSVSIGGERRLYNFYLSQSPTLSKFFKCKNLNF